MPLLPSRYLNVHVKGRKGGEKSDEMLLTVEFYLREVPESQPQISGKLRRNDPSFKLVAAFYKNKALFWVTALRLHTHPGL